jgi:hypothetical protein
MLILILFLVILLSTWIILRDRGDTPSNQIQSKVNIMPKISNTASLQARKAEMIALAKKYFFMIIILIGNILRNINQFENKAKCRPDYSKYFAIQLDEHEYRSHDTKYS